MRSAEPAVRLDRQRLRIDAITALIPFVVITGWAVWALVSDHPGWSRHDTVETWGLLLAMGVGPQLAQATLAQLVFPRVPLPAWVRGATMVQTWFASLVLGGWAVLGAPSLWPAYFALYVVVPLLVLTRLMVRSLVREGAAQRRQPATAA